MTVTDTSRSTSTRTSTCRGASEVDAIVTVTAERRRGSHRQARAAPRSSSWTCSGSMDYRPTRCARAKQATSAAIDALRDGVAFAVIAGTDSPGRSTPPGRRPLIAPTRAPGRRPKRRCAALNAGGGTAIGAWLRLANQLFARHPDAIRHAILLTDGKNEHETRRRARRGMLAVCEGQFQCDCRGVGTDWEVERAAQGRVGAARHGRHRRRPGGSWRADFDAMIERAMGKAVADVALRLWTPQGATSGSSSRSRRPSRT